MRRKAKTELEKLSDAGYPAEVQPANTRANIADTDLALYGLQLQTSEADVADTVVTTSVLLYQKSIAELYSANNDGRPSPQPVYAPDAIQGFYDAVMQMSLLTGIRVVAVVTVYDGTTDPTAGEVISVAEANIRSYPSIPTTAADTDIVIVVHVKPATDTALLDSTYGKDIAHATDFHGETVVFGGKVVHDAPALDLQPMYGATVIPITNTYNSSVDGSWNTTSFPVPMSIGSSNPPCNDCLTFIDVPNPSPQPPPPPPPTGGGLPTITPPSPYAPVNFDGTCSNIFSDVGNGLFAVFEAVSIDLTAYGNIAIAGIGIVLTYPAQLGSAITTWIGAHVSDLDLTCDKVLNIKLKLLVTLTDTGIFGFIPNPFPTNNVTPRITHMEALDAAVDDIFYFPIDAKTNQPIIGGTTFPTYQENYYNQTHTISIRPKDRTEGQQGYEQWAFMIDASDYVTSVSLNPLQLQMCGISYKKHQYLFNFTFDGTDPFKIISTHSYIYDHYENARIEVPTGYFESGGYTINTDAVHGFDITPDLICALDVAGTEAALYGSITCTHNHWGTTNLVDIFLRVYEGGTLIATNVQTVQVDQALGTVNFALTATGTFLVGHTYQLSFQSGSFPDDTYVLHSLSGYIK